MLVSVVLPVYKSAPFIKEVYRRITTLSIKNTSFEIIFVDDGCPMGSWEIIREMASIDSRVKGIKLSKNFGQHFAISAGLQECKGDLVVVMDCDLQEDPTDIPLLIEKLESTKSDVILTLRKKRSYSAVKNFQAKMFYWTLAVLGSRMEFSERISTFSCSRKKVIKEFLKYKDVHRHYLMILRSLGFKTNYVEINHSKREEGKSSYSLLKLLRHSIDGIVFQSNRLLKISIIVGACFVLFSLILSIRILMIYALQGSIPGYTSLIISIFMCTGVILFTLGVHGIYIGKIFDQTRGRPIYIIDEFLNLGETK